MATSTLTRRGTPEVRIIGGVGRGWGQGVWVRGVGWTWPQGRPWRRGSRPADPIDDQLRHAIAWSPLTSATIGRRAGLPAGAIDSFMRGGDLPLSAAASVARIVGVQLVDQSVRASLVALAARCPDQLERVLEDGGRRRGS